MNVMQIYKVIVSNKASSDLDDIAKYIASIYRPDSGHKFVNKILGQLASLSYTAGIYKHSNYTIAKQIHPNAKTLSIVNHRWTVIFHTFDNFAIIDRIMPSKMMIE